ncbi:glycosyltransferase [Lactiplantibacillus carotarum]|uniref:glycosyltransferase n=1 Tax=Lactiplantibacillus carotarum TaxID=2993456 RepID=UPI00298F3510|nr:glycosyltransferase [Lactiplantibacillus carotarum]
MDKIACVIVTYNRKILMSETLTSVLTQDYAPEYVIVVDNASTDGVSELLHSEFKFDDNHLQYFKSFQNLGGCWICQGNKYGTKNRL